MKQLFKLLTLLILLTTTLTASAQETPPPLLHSVNAQFYINLADSSIWHQKGRAPDGTSYGWERLAKYADISGLSGDGYTGLVTTISGTNAITTPGSWTIYGQPYSKGTTTTTAIPTVSTGLERQDLLVADTNNHIVKIAGTAGSTFTTPDQPEATILIAIINTTDAGSTTVIPPKNKFVTLNTSQTGTNGIYGTKAANGEWRFKSNVKLRGELPIGSNISAGNLVLRGFDSLVMVDSTKYTPERKLFGTTGVYAIGDTLNGSAEIYADAGSQNAGISAYYAHGNLSGLVQANASSVQLLTSDNTGSQDILLNSPSSNTPISIRNDNGFGIAYTAEPNNTNPLQLIDNARAIAIADSVGSGGSSLIPTNGLQSIAPDSIGLGGQLTYDVNIDPTGHVFQIGASSPYTALIINEPVKSASLQAGNGIKSSAIYLDGTNSTFSMITSSTGSNGSGILADRSKITMQTFGGAVLQSGISIGQSMNVYDGLNNIGLVDSLHHDTTGGNPLQLAEIGDVRDIVAHSAGGITGITGDVTASGSGSVSATVVQINGITKNYYDPTSSIQTQLNGKQATLVSGTNIKTINSQPLLGSGNVDITTANTDTTVTGFAPKIYVNNFLSKATAASTYVPVTRTVAGFSLGSNISLSSLTLGYGLLGTTYNPSAPTTAKVDTGTTALATKPYVNNFLTQASATTKYAPLAYAANSFRVNNTSSSATPTTTPYFYVAEQSYTKTVTWTGTTAPSGTAVATYKWQQIGGMVHLKILVTYPTPGVANTAAAAPLPDDVPAPKLPSNVANVAGNAVGLATGRLGTSLAFSGNTPQAAILRVNAAATGYEIYVQTNASLSADDVFYDVWYDTN